MKSHSVRFEKRFSVWCLNVRESKDWPRLHEAIESPGVA